MTLRMYNNRTPANDPEHESHQNRTEPAEEQQTAPARKNPRLVIGNLDYFDMLMEMEED